MSAPPTCVPLLKNPLPVRSILATLTLVFWKIAILPEAPPCALLASNATLLVAVAFVTRAITPMPFA